MRTLLRSVDRREESEDNKRTEVLPVAVKQLRVGMRLAVRKRPEGVDRVQCRRAAEIGLGQIQYPVLRGKFQDVRTGPQVQELVGRVALVGGHILQRRDRFGAYVRHV